MVRMQKVGRLMPSAGDMAQSETLRDGPRLLAKGPLGLNTTCSLQLRRTRLAAARNKMRFTTTPSHLWYSTVGRCVDT